MAHEKHNHACHHHLHHASSNIRVAFFLNFGFAMLEIFGGLWINSVAILSDALHNLGDSLSLGLDRYFEKSGEAGTCQQCTFGL